MFEIHKPKPKSIVVIRAATGSELSAYEKSKLATVEANAQENKIETISLNGNTLPIDPINKEVRIDLGGLAFKQKVTSDELSPDELFFIKCELGDITTE